MIKQIVIKNTGKGYRNDSDETLKARICDRNINGLEMYTWYTLKPGDTIESAC